jgi:hypothetical protein
MHPTIHANCRMDTRRRSCPHGVAGRSPGGLPEPQGSAEYTQFVARELDRWVRVIKIAGIKGE